MSLDFRRVSFICLAALALSAPSAARAQTPNDPNPPLVPQVSRPDAAVAAEDAAEPPARVVPERTRPPALPALYGSFAALQILDVHSTLRALGNGGREANPMMRGAAGSPAAMLAIKMGATATTIYATERLWKKNRVAAVVLMAALNSAYLVIVAHNYSAGRG
jgi:hypothetical protein